MEPRERLIFPLDVPDKTAAESLISRLKHDVGLFKVGLELFVAEGPAFLRFLTETARVEYFLDLKFHDIPNTVASACHAAAELGVWMVNVHALGGERMLLAAREGIARAGRRPLLIAVTILTSMDEHDLAGVGLSGTPADNVMRLATLARSCELDGVVCSSRETAMLRERLGSEFLLVTPGIRPAGSAGDDQRRVMTPVDAISNGSSYLVIGRPVTRADDPVSVLRTINSELSALG